MKPAVKAGILLCLSLTGSALFLSSVFGQPRPGTAIGRPPGQLGGAPGTMSGMRPGFSGGVSGAQLGTRPGTALGATGSVTGTRIGGVSGMGVGGGVGGISGMGGTEWVYTCTVCGKEVMRSRMRLSNVKNCCVSPRGGGGVIGVRPPPGVTDPGPAILPPVDNNVFPPAQPFAPPPAPFADTGTDPGPSTPESSSGFSKMFLALGIGVVLFGLVILGGVVVLVVQSQKGGKAAPRRRRFRDDEY